MSLPGSVTVRLGAVALALALGQTPVMAEPPSVSVAPPIWASLEMDPELRPSAPVLEALTGPGLAAPASQPLVAREGIRAMTQGLGARLLDLRSGGQLSLLKEKPEDITGTIPVSGKDKVVLVIEADRDRWYEVYAQGRYTDLRIDRIGAAGSLDVSTATASAGIEYHPNHYFTLGLAASWLTADSHLGGNHGSSDVSGGAISVYGSWRDGPFYVDGLAAYGRLDHEISRRAAHGAIARGETESNVFTAEVNTGANFRLGPFVTGPLLSLGYTGGDISGYQESGAGAFNLAVAGQSFHSLQSEAGWQASLPVETKWGLVTPHLRAAWVHEYLNDWSSVSARSASYPYQHLSLNGIGVPDDYGLLGAGLIWTRSDRFSLAADYEFLFGEDFVRHALLLTGTYRF